MVWQDFMFGCGNYPTWPALLDSIRKEAVCNLRRLRHHPSIVIYAGNNEDYQVQEQSGLTYNYEDKNRDNWLKTDFPARYIYEEILPTAVRQESPDVYYHPGSPWGDGKPTPDPTVGDMHQWNGEFDANFSRSSYVYTNGKMISLAWNSGEISNFRDFGWTFQQRVWNGSIPSCANNRLFRGKRSRQIPAIPRS